MNKNMDSRTGKKIFAGTILGRKGFTGIFIADSGDYAFVGWSGAERYSTRKYSSLLRFAGLCYFG